MSETRIWYINVNSQTYGPYSRDEIISMLKTETIKYSDYIFREGFKNWDYLYNIPEFDRRIINPGGDQPVVHAPAEEVPQEVVASQQPQTEELWYVHDGEHQNGPYTASYIKEALDNKTVFWTYYVWKEGFDNWVQIKQCKEFDRRKMPRGQTPDSVDITTDYNEIQKGAVSSLPKKEDDPKIYGAAQEPSSFQYRISDLDQEELRGKYPIKGILILLTVVAVLFGVVRAYPWMSQRAREKKAMNIYELGVNLIDKQNKPEDGFVKLFDLMDMYPNSIADRKNENYIRSKEPMIKAQLADEARKIKNLIDTFYKKYGVLPANALDIAYVPPFWLKFFGEAYFKRVAVKKVEVMVKGTRLPVESYVFITDSDNKELEQDVKEDEFASKTRQYIRLAYTGAKSLVKPLELPKILNSTVLSPEKQKEAKEQAAAILRKEQAQKKKETTVKKTTKKVQEDRVPLDDEQPSFEEDQTEAQDQEYNSEEGQYQDQEQTTDGEDQEANLDEYGDSIEKIRKEK